jgi:hypothetical protein
MDRQLANASQQVLKRLGELREYRVGDATCPPQKSMKGYRPARKRVAVSVRESVRIIRELQGLSQNELVRRTGIVAAHDLGD